jgi:hypothetical protein
MGGHLHVVAGDLTRISCDAWLLPTDNTFHISRSFASAIHVDAGAALPGLDWQGERVLHYRRSGDTDIWLGDVGRWGEPPQCYAEAVAPFAERASALIRGRVERRRPMLALGVLGTGEGGMRDDKGAVYEVLLPALYAAADTYNVDLVLVCWKRRAYSAAQRVRRRLLDEQHGGDRHKLWDLGTRAAELVTSARPLATRSQRGDLVLFMGAGVSAGAGLPAWQALLDDVAQYVGLGPEECARLRRLDVRDQASVIQRRLEPAQTLQQALEPFIDRTTYALTHAHLASLPTREAVTTNYDRLFEEAVAAVDGPIAVLPYQPAGAGQRWLLKLHGSIERNDSIVLTRNDYLSVPSRHSALFGLVQAMLITKHMLFVGYSLTDEDFHQLVYEVRLARSDSDGEHLGTVLTLFDDPLFDDLWAGDLTVVPMAPASEGEPSSKDVDSASRVLQIFLDLVAFEAADLDAFLLDETYEGLLTEPEQRLVELLRPILSELALDHGGELPAARRVRQLLDELGATEDSAQPLHAD